MDRLKKFLEKFWQSEEEVCTIVSHGAVFNCLGLLIMQSPLDHFWTMYMSGCGVSKVYMKGISKFSIDYWNARHFLKGK